MFLILSFCGEVFLLVILLSAEWPKTNCIEKWRKRETRKKKRKRKKKKEKKRKKKEAWGSKQN